MPLELLETIAHLNFNAPRPRPLDCGLAFDLLKIRKLVDEATNLAVRASSDNSSPTLTNVNGRGYPQALLTGSGHGSKLSKERQFRMREQASQKLARAYRLDEIACSVATMQGATPLENVASLVLRRNPNDFDAKYVDFFHEKIPSRTVAESTDLDKFTEIVEGMGSNPEVLRTRAAIKTFKNDQIGAVQDYTAALSNCRFGSVTHSQQLQLQHAQKQRRAVILSEDDQPGSLEIQLLFNRATMYLNMAVDQIKTAMDINETKPDSSSGADANKNGSSSPVQVTPEQRDEARKLVKLYAKRAMRDLQGFFSRLDYSPDLPVRFAKEFNTRVTSASQTFKANKFGSYNYTNGETPHRVFTLAELFEAVPPSDLPPWPNMDINPADLYDFPRPPADGKCEWVSYHPLLIESLNTFLLCHALAQTSTKEIQRHAYMAARISRLADGYPYFQASRSPARADFNEVLQKANNWIELVWSWEDLCVPAPLPVLDDHDNDAQDRVTAYAAPTPQHLVSALNMLKRPPSASSSSPIVPRNGSLPEPPLPVAPKFASTNAENKDKQDDAEEAKEKDKPAASGDKTLALNRLPPSSYSNKDSRHRPDHVRRYLTAELEREYMLLGDRADHIAKWILEAPRIPGTGKRKKRTKKSAAGAKAAVGEVEEGVQALELDG